MNFENPAQAEQSKSSQELLEMIRIPADQENPSFNPLKYLVALKSEIDTFSGSPEEELMLREGFNAKANEIFDARFNEPEANENPDFDPIKFREALTQARNDFPFFE